jgi:hypothetical protein
MGDELQRQALARNLASRLQPAGLDELRVIDRILSRLELGRQRYGELDLGAPRDWRAERFEEELDALVYQVCSELAAEDLARQSLRSAARAEMLGEGDQRPDGEFAPDQHRTRVTDESARLAAGEIDTSEPYADWELREFGEGE